TAPVGEEPAPWGPGGRPRGRHGEGSTAKQASLASTLSQRPERRAATGGAARRSHDITPRPKGIARRHRGCHPNRHSHPNHCPTGFVLIGPAGPAGVSAGRQVGISRPAHAPYGWLAGTGRSGAAGCAVVAARTRRHG